MKCSTRLHFIRVFTVCQSIGLGVSSIQNAAKPRRAGLHVGINYLLVLYLPNKKGFGRPPDKSVYLKINFLISYKSICRGYSKELSQ